MDGRHFDSVTRALLAHSPRRVALGLLLGGALGVRELADGAAKKKGKGKGKGKKKKKCGNGQKKCGNTCIAQSACCTFSDCDRCAREDCLNGVCDCNPNLIRSNGVCGTFPTCYSVLSVVTSASDCCSEEAEVVEGGQLRCLPGTFLCLTHLDCVSGPCRGFMCPEQYAAQTGGGC